MVRKPPGTHTQWNNGYFTLTRNRKYEDMVIYVAPRLCADAELGTTVMSKRFKIERFDGEAGPTITPFVLRAWMMQRVQFNNWVERTSARFFSDLKS